MLEDFPFWEVVLDFQIAEELFSSSAYLNQRKSQLDRSFCTANKNGGFEK